MIVCDQKQAEEGEILTFCLFFFFKAEGLSLCTFAVGFNFFR